MQIIPAIQKRCSVRQYVDKPIADEELSLIIEAARMAPSGKNTRANKLYVFKNRKVIDELNNLFKDVIASGKADEISAEAGRFALKPGYHFAYNAPVFIITTEEKDGYNCYSNGACLLENAMLQAAELNIGSCWINTARRCGIDERVISFLSEYGYDPNKEQITGGLALGYTQMKLSAKIQYSGNEVIII